MNVSRTGYYTSEYIDHRINGTPRNFRTPEPQQFSRDENVRTKSIRFNLPSSESEIDVIADPDDLPEDITPAQLTYLHKSEGQTIQKYSRRSHTVDGANGSANYDNYYRTTKQKSSLPDDDLFDDGISSTHTEEMFFHKPNPKLKQQKAEYKGYYMDQKKRYDEAEFIKPRNYKHKTFKDVFNEDRHDDDNYNPIDIVFEDSEKVREIEQKKKFMRAVRTVLTRLGKDDYDSYDYYTQQQLEKEKQRSREIRKKEQERIRINSELEQSRSTKAAAVEHKRLEKEEAVEQKRMAKEEAAEMKRLKKKEAAELKRLDKEQARANKKKSKLKPGMFKPPAAENVDSEDPDVRSVPDSQEVVNDIFVDHYGSDYEDDPQHVSNKNLRKNLKKKWHLAKKQLGENYFDNYAKLIEEEELAKKRLNFNEMLILDEAEYTEKKEQLEVNEHDYNDKEPIHVTALERYVGPNSNFNPYWNYILSFLVYNQQGGLESNVEGPTEKVVEVVEPEEGKTTDQKVNKKNKKAGKSKASVEKHRQKKENGKGYTKRKLASQGFAFNLPKAPKINLQPAKAVFTNWNTPASAFFTGQHLSDLRELVVSPRDQLMKEPLIDENGYPIEHTIMYEGSDVEEELIYDPDSDEFKPLNRANMLENDGLISLLGGLVAPLGLLNELLMGDSVVVSQFNNLHVGAPLKVILNINQLIKRIRFLKIVFAPIDVISEMYPSTQTIVILLELVIFMWLLYELSLLIDAICMAVKAVCAPMIAIGKFMNRIV